MEKVHYPYYYLYPRSEYEALRDDSIPDEDEESEEDKKVQAEESRWESDTDR